MFGWQGDNMDLREKQFDKKRVTCIAVLVIVAVCAIGYIIYYNWKLDRNEEQYEELRQTETVVEAIVVQDTEQEETIYCEQIYDFEELQETNEDIYAWIIVPGTQVDYPILQSGTDNYYLDHNLDHSTGYPGCIYSNSCNARDFSDKNTVLYGHNMKNGSMFGCLHEFEDADFFDENRWIYVYTPKERLSYEIYAAVKFSDVYIPAYYGVSDGVGEDAFLSDIVTASEDSDVSHIADEMELTGEENIIVLSTCVNGEESRRYLVVGVLKEEAFYQEGN